MFVWERFEDVKGEKTLFSHVTCATDTENLKVVFVAVTDMLVRSILGEIGVVWNVKLNNDVLINDTKKLRDLFFKYFFLKGFYTTSSRKNIYH